QGRLAGAFRAVDFGDPPARDATDTQGKVNGQRPRRDHVNLKVRRIAKPDDGSIAKALGQVREGIIKGFEAGRVGHVRCSWWGTRNSPKCSYDALIVALMFYHVKENARFCCTQPP